MRSLIVLAACLAPLALAACASDEPVGHTKTVTKTTTDTPTQKTITTEKHEKTTTLDNN